MSKLILLANAHYIITKKNSKHISDEFLGRLIKISPA